MSRGNTRVVRPIVVWLTVTLAALASSREVPSAWLALAAAGDSHADAADAVVAGCALLLAAALGWVWLVATVTVTQVLAGTARAGSGGTTRRLVLLACGAVVVTGGTLPAHAEDGGGLERLAGLGLPDRAVAPAAATSTPDLTHAPTPTPASTSPSPPTSPATYVVRAGDSLWSIARAHPGDRDDIGLRWREIWAANRGVVGADPDLIHPGQALVLPGDTPRTRTHEDGER
ncbi:hypothetical protein GCM10011376_14820 [Nocardioides flavus (ex Wang et al. 2016)]|uniref:LysM domain-containing protein n=1 Tax=Nocardioides flavus (ex Wang et al. 2016) TaxID=2058780 RepID=A0ABQ3HGW4_9ACTN|nr:LysM domain-containing protein [Nocardioides flavus (ex Wang et al. 2016)]GHE16872.1 hypothetical protein GCM10011376_14820 [Nocardioides flavus (ex Wang et al. 2016)]